MLSNHKHRHGRPRQGAGDEEDAKEFHFAARLLAWTATLECCVTVYAMNISCFAGKVNQVLGQKRQFDWCAWLRYTEYKMEMLKRYHVPTAINNKAIASVDVDYLKDFSRKRPLLDNDKTRKKQLNEEVRKGVEQILDEMVEQCALPDSGKEMPVFKPSLFARAVWSKS